MIEVAHLRSGVGEQLSGDDLWNAVGLLAALIDSSSDERPSELARTTLRRLGETTADARVGALVDWWSVTRLGERSCGRCFNLAEDAPGTPREAMEALLEHARASDRPSLPMLRLRRQLDEVLVQLSSSLHHPQGKVGSQGQTWEDIEARYRPVYEQLTAGFKPQRPSITRSDIRDMMRDHEVRRGSDIWRKIERDWEELDDLFGDACALAGALEDGEVPAPAMADGPTGAPSAPADLAERFLLRDLVNGSPHGEQLVEQLLPRCRMGDESDRDWLAVLVNDYAETHRRTVPDLQQQLGRVRGVERELQRMRKLGFDVDLAELHLSEGSLEEAEQLIEDIRLRRAAADRERSLRDELARLVESAHEAGADEGVMNELELAAADLDDQALDDAHEKIRQLREGLAAQLQDARTVRANELLHTLQRLGGSAPTRVIDRLSDRLVDDDDLDILIDAVDQAEAGVRMRVEDRIGLIHGRLENEQQLLGDGAREAVARLVREARDRVSEGDVAAADDASREALRTLDQAVPFVWSSNQGERALVEHLRRYVTGRLAFAETDVDRLYVALKTKRFAILSGLTGSGKTTIARLFAEALGASQSNGRFARVAVRPNWVDEAEVLGYVNPVSRRFEPGCLAMLIRTCEQTPDLPVFCLLDEMNLAPVEFYFADFLSALEEATAGVETTLSLYPPGAALENSGEWPSALAFPENLFVIGTVNVDETTRPLSDRVLDRANVIQLAVGVDDRHHHPAPSGDLEPRWSIRLRDWRAVCATTPSAEFHGLLVEIGELLNGQMRLGLGVRAHVEIERFVANSTGVLDAVDAVDLALLQRVVPKIRGFKRDLAQGLEELRDLLDEADVRRTRQVIDAWLHEQTSDDAFLDGTHASVGLSARN